MKVLRLVPRQESPDLTQEYRRRKSDIIRACERLLDRARSGELKGFLWVIKTDGDKHETGTTGDYNADLEDAARAAMSMLDQIHQPHS
jgi:hypothetical protein